MNNKLVAILIKMLSIKAGILFSVIFIITNPGFGQDCAQTLLKSASLNVGKEYRPFNIYRVAFIESNTPILCNAIFPSNKDYLISFRSELDSKPLKIRLIDKGSKLELYNNANDNYKEEITFSVADNPINVLIEIIVTGKTTLSKTDPNLRACAGFWIFFKKCSD